MRLGSKGIQIVPIATSRQAVIDALRGNRRDAKKEFATFIARDWKNKRIAEISCSPDSLGNYYEESTLPHGLSPAFFRSEVLSKYKADREKYHLEERLISCRGSWSLEYDINEAGQVHAYLIDFRPSPVCRAIVLEIIQPETKRDHFRPLVHNRFSGRLAFFRRQPPAELEEQAAEVGTVRGGLSERKRRSTERNIR